MYVNLPLKSFPSRGEHFQKNFSAEMLKLLRKSKSFFDVNYIYFDARVDKFVKRPKTRSNWVKLITCYLIFGAICLNGFYSILFTQPGILETSSILLFASPFCVSMILLSPMLLQPDPFVFLLNARQEFALRNINGNLLRKLILRNVVKLRNDET